MAARTPNLNRAPPGGRLMALVLPAPVRAVPQTGDPAARLARAAAEAESRLAAGDLAAAQRLYRGRALRGPGAARHARSAGRADRGRPPGPLRARRPTCPTIRRRRSRSPRRSCRRGDAAQAVAVLEAHAGAGRATSRRRACWRSALRLRRPARGGAAHAAAGRRPPRPTTRRSAFVIAGEYLWLKQVDAAERLFANVI